VDVRLPDGTVIKNVPDNITKADLTAKLKSNGYDTSSLTGTPTAPPTAGERTQAAVGGVNRGISGLVGLPVDTIENIINLGIAAYGATKQATTGEPGPEPLHGSVGGSEYLANKMQSAGINTQNPRPDDPASRMLNTAGTIVGGSVLPGAGVRSTLGAAAVGALAGEVLGPQYAGVGAMVPGAARQAAVAAKEAVANPATVQRNVQTFKEAGTTPDVAQATDSNFFRGLTNVVARVPGGQGVITKFRDLEQEALGNRAGTGVTAERAGRAVKQGITGEGGFLDKTKATWEQLDQKLADKIGGQYMTPPTNTLAALDDLTKVTPGAEKSTASLINPKIAEFKAALQQDVQGNLGGVPFDALRSLRTKVGSMLDDALVSGVPGGELKKLYGAISKDIQGAADAVGAGEDFSRQSNYYKARMDRIENTLDSVLGKGREPEAIFKAVAPTDVESVNKVRRVMRSLNPEERQTVSEAIVNRLGRATPGKQDITGEKFSSDTFLTNWSRINPSAKSQLFPNPDMRQKLDSIAEVSDNIRQGKAVFGNTSGTAQGMTAGAVYGSVPVAAGLAMSGNLPAAATTLAVSGSMIAGANIGAKMLTSPKVVNWLAQSSKARTNEQTIAQLSRLAVIYNSTKDQQLKQELGDYLQSIGR
jgi:hypothetical protein